MDDLTNVGDEIGGHLIWHDDGRVWDLGPPLVDTDNDGIPDTLTRSGPDGLEIFTDTDHDGEIDKVIAIGPDGSYESTTWDDANRQWRATDTGRLG